MAWSDVFSDDLFQGSMSEWDPRSWATGTNQGGDSSRSQFVPYKQKSNADERWNSSNGSYNVAPTSSWTESNERLTNDNPFSWFGLDTPEGWNDSSFSSWYDPGVGNSAISDTYNRGISDWGALGKGPNMSIMTPDMQKHETKLSQDERGNWRMAQGNDAFEKYGYRARDRYDENGNFAGQILMPTEASRDRAGSIGWKGADAFVNPNEFQKDSYNWLMSKEIQDKLANEYNRPGFENDYIALLADPELRPLYEEYFRYMVDLDKGYFRDILNDPQFQGGNGEFDWSFDPYWSYVDDIANVSNMIAGNGTQEGNDWITSGSIQRNQALANYLAKNVPDLAFAIGSEIPDDLASSLVKVDDKTLMKGDGSSSSLFRADDSGTFYEIPEDRDSVANTLRALFIKDALTNRALDDRYGQYKLTADDLNDIARFFGQPDLYYSLANGENGPEDPYALFGGEPEEWYNRYSQFEPLALSSGDNKNFRTGATGYAQNNRIGKVNKVQ